MTGGIITLYKNVIVNAATDDWSQANFTSIGTGGGQSCGTEGGLVYCWGNNSNGQLGNSSLTQSRTPDVVGTSGGVLAGKTITAIAVGFSHSCAVADGAAYCWGSNFNGQLGNNSTTQSTVPVAVSTAGVLAGKTVTAIAAGNSSTCAIADGAAYCWGNNTNGQLGNNSTTQSTVPVAVSTAGVLAGKTVTAIDVKLSHTCAIADGAAFCWGFNSAGQLGNNTITESTSPVAVSTATHFAGKTVTVIAVGYNHSCAVADGAAYCWGSGTTGRLGNGATSQQRVPVPVSTTTGLAGKTVTDISVHTGHTCAVASGVAYCWGLRTNGRLGDNSTSGNSTTPVAVNAAGVLSGKTVTAISAGFTYSCAIASGAAYCWGDNVSYQLGDNTSIQSTIPVAVKRLVVATQASYRFFANANSSDPGAVIAGVDQSATIGSAGAAFRLRVGVKANMMIDNFTAISAGSNHACATSSGAAYCWGGNFNGQLGNYTTTVSFYPTPTDMTGVLAGKSITAISAGVTHTCAIADGGAYCWGKNSGGQLGDNSTTQSAVPVAVNAAGLLTGKTITAITTGDAHTCALADGTAYCWGSGSYGQLGHASINESLVPVAVDTSGVLAGKTITAISAGFNHTCAIADGGAYCWGDNFIFGMLGNNSTTQSTVPVAVDTSGVLAGKTITAISAGYTHTCAIADDGAYCWGDGFYGQLGNASTSTSFIPVAVNTGGLLGGKTVTAISAGNAHTCAIADGAAYCWGVNSGHLGNNTSTSSNTPVAVDTTGILNGKTVNSLSTGSVFSCVIADSDTASCWGLNNSGQLGVGNHTQPLVPQAPLRDVSVTMLSNSAAFKLKYAQKTAPSCSSQLTGFADVTTSSAIAWNVNASVSNGTAIASNTNDPTPLGDTVYQTYVSDSPAFVNTRAVPGNKYGIWDLSLKDNSGLADTTYCLKVVYATSGAPLEQYDSNPEITTAPAGSALAVEFVNSSGNPISMPSLAMEPRNVSNACQATGSLLGNESSGMRLRVYKNSGTTGWNTSLAPTGGTTALWSRMDNNAHYDFNDPSGSPAGCNSGSDGDGHAGQLSIGTDTSTVEPKPGCGIDGLSWATGDGLEKYSQGVVDAITIISGSSASVSGCYWDIGQTELYQSIPANQAPGEYYLDITATIVAQ
ncbi:MAG: hypothetical protein ABWX90_03810 [Candidatus Saccharimonadales bacterium]